MGNRNKYNKHKIVGYISESVADEWDLPEQKGKPIFQTFSFYKHIQKHIQDFGSLDSFEYALNNIENIILNYDFVIHNGVNESLEYYKKLNGNVVVVAKLTNKNKLYLSSIYPVSDFKVENKKEKALLKKYVKNFDEEEYNKKLQKKYDNKKKKAKCG